MKRIRKESHMAGKPIFPMAYTINPGRVEKIYYIGFPSRWKEALLKITKENNSKFKSEYGLPTSALQKMIDSWMEGIVSISPLKEHSDDSKWLASIYPIDEKRIPILFEIIRIWIKATYVSMPKTSFLVKQKANELYDSMQSEEFIALRTDREVCLSNADGRVSDEAYQAIPLLVVNRLVGQNIEIGGTTVHLLYSGKNELVSSAIKNDKTGHRYSFVFQFSVQTTPPQRQALLLCNASIRRWTPERKDKTKAPFLANAIMAHIKISDDKYCQIPIQYSSETKDLDWKPQDKECYNLYSYSVLPNVNNLWKMVDEGIEGILLPYTNGMSGFVSSKIGTGVPVKDKAEIYMQFLDLLFDFVSKPVAPIRSSKRQKKVAYYKSPQEYSSREEFRQWVSSCAETSKICFELYGNLSDPEESKLLETIGQKIFADFGENSIDSCMHVEIVRKEIGDIALPVEKNEKIARCDTIKNDLGETEDVVACICIIPGANAFKDNDPKLVIRNAFACSGRVVQFVVLSAADETSEMRKVDHAVYDLYRQLGITTLLDIEELQAHPQNNTTCVGMHICTQVHNIRKKARFMPVYVSLDLCTGTTRVQCDAFEKNNVNYRQACLEMAKLFWDENLEQLCVNASFSPAKQKLIELKNIYDEGTSGAVLFIHSDGNTRPLWGGISDKAISNYTEISDYIPERIDAGSSKTAYPMSLNETGIRIIRIRDNSEIPDYYTSRRDDADDKYSSATGVFQYGKVFWAISAKPNDPRYNQSLLDSRINHPLDDYAEKDMIEIYPLQLQHGDDPWMWAKFVSELCKLSIQYDQSTILPLPLHLAKNLEEYLFEV